LLLWEYFKLSGGDEKGMPSSSGTMSDHLKKYRQYIDELKQGRSSGISAAFGRATDLLPAEIMTIKAEPANLVEHLIKLESNVLADDYDRQYLMESVQSLVQAYADDMTDPVGSIVETESGPAEVLSVYIESGIRMFMLSDLSTIDESTFQRTLVGPDSVESLREEELLAPAPVQNSSPLLMAEL